MKMLITKMMTMMQISWTTAAEEEALEEGEGPPGGRAGRAHADWNGEGEVSTTHVYFNGKVISHKKLNK